MILTCPKCQSQYSLADEKLGTGGRTVRCVSCHHTWFQMPEHAEAPPPVMEAVVPVEKPAVEQPHVEEAPPAKDTAALGEILTNATKAAAGSPEPVARAPVKAVAAEDSPPVVMHDPLGVSANTFGLLFFVLCVSLTMAAVMLCKKPILKKWPQMAVLYTSIGVRTHAPGEGLRMSEMTAEQRIDKPNTLLVEGKITNMNEQPTSNPPLYVVVRDDQHKILKEMTLKAGSTQIPSGENMPMMLQLPDIPEAATTIEMRAAPE